MKVALLQTVSGTRWADNLAWVRAALVDAVADGAELVCLPEYFCVMGMKDTDKLALQEDFGSGPIQETMGSLAREHAVWLAAGTLPLRTSDPLHATNSSLVFNPQGQCAARYDKIHLFAFSNGQEHYDEARVLQPGTQPAAFDLPSRDGHTWRVGLSVCYDLRFPELYRALGADLLLVPSAFTYTTGQAHWELLLRARAIENLAFVAAAAQGGTHENGRKTWGHSMLVGPWGQVLAQRETGPGWINQELDIAQLQERRQQLPALSHKRPGFSSTVSL
jgi:deaminated glutathione amidase